MKRAAAREIARLKARLTRKLDRLIEQGADRYIDPPSYRLEARRLKAELESLEQLREARRV